MLQKTVRFSCCLLLIVCMLAGCTNSAAKKEEQAILDYVRSTGVVYVEQLTEEQLQRLFDAGIDGVEEELREMVAEHVAENSQEPVLGPTVEFLRAWSGEKDGVSYVIDLSKVSSAECDELMLAYQNGGIEQLEVCVEEWWADGWVAVKKKVD